MSDHTAASHPSPTLSPVLKTEPALEADDDAAVTDAVFRLGADAMADGELVQEGLLFGQTDTVDDDETLQAWEVASPAVRTEVDWTEALFNSDPRLPFQVLHLGALLCVERDCADGRPPTPSPKAATMNPFEALHMLEAPVQLHVTHPEASGRRGARRKAATRVALVAPALSPHLSRRTAVQREESALDEVINARSSTALRQFVKPEALAVLGGLRASELLGSDHPDAKKSRTQPIKHTR